MLIERIGSLDLNKRLIDLFDKVIEKIKEYGEETTKILMLVIG